MHKRSRKFQLLAGSVALLVLVFGIGCRGFFVNPTLSTLTVTPETPTIQIGNTRQLTATGTYNDNSTKNVTATVSWSSSDPAIASVSSTGVVTAVSIGAAPTITASLGTVSGSTTVTVSLGNIASIAVTPQNSTINHGSNQQYRAMATLSDGTVHDITGSATWATSNSNAGTIDSSGLFTSLTTGTFPQTTTITATSGTNNISGQATLTVN